MEVARGWNNVTARRPAGEGRIKLAVVRTWGLECKKRAQAAVAVTGVGGAWCPGERYKKLSPPILLCPPPVPDLNTSACSPHWPELVRLPTSGSVVIFLPPSAPELDKIQILFSYAPISSLGFTAGSHSRLCSTSGNSSPTDGLDSIQRLVRCHRILGPIRHRGLRSDRCETGQRLFVSETCTVQIVLQSGRPKQNLYRYIANSALHVLTEHVDRGASGTSRADQEVVL